MTEWLLEREIVARLASFTAVFATLALWELLAARRGRARTRRDRWVANLSVLTLNTALVRVVFPAAAVGGAWLAAERGWGLLNVVSVPAWIAVAISVVVLDLTLYLQHVAFHSVPALWRLHMMHHADLDVDVTTGTRFHPIEVFLSVLIKLGVVLALGAPALGVLAFEVLLNATSMFNHSNIWLTGTADRVLRAVVVTPDMHRVHHSIDRDECNSNFGFNLPWWDFVFGTYRGQPREGHDRMTTGVEHLLAEGHQSLGWMLALPFRSTGGDYPRRSPARAINARSGS